MMERLSGEFNRGYTKAIQDIQDIFDYVQIDLRFHRKAFNKDTAKQLLKCVMENRAKLREDRGGFIRYNSALKAFEYFEGK